MLSCADCAAAVPEGEVHCPVCGMPVGSAAQTVCEVPKAVFSESTGTGEPRRPRFATGAVLASRYQIVTLLGCGGMGEVYRADDLKLNQAVALKFLPPAQRSDAAALDRLRREVRLARQISHPNVCRVFDLGEIEEASFLCMEYIDGEDLAGLLRRIGRLPVDKALEIACQLAAGLAAIHEGGLLHRDLKPGNVMIDGRGKARITDFGLAIPADEPRGDAGTPAYMAPEQRAGGQVSIQSDLFSLGLVICEMLTGMPVCLAPSRQAPSLPENLSDRLSPGIKAVLLRCLAPDPAQRPSSALQVLAAFTGKDLLALAVNDGLILPPEAVAAAPKAGSLRPAVACSLLLGVLVCLGAVLALAGEVQSFRQTPSELPPEVLAERARGLLREMGVTAPPRDWASGFSFNPSYGKYLANDLTKDQARRLLAAGRPPLYAFWYRTSPDLLLAQDGVTPEDPSRNTPGQAYLELDLKGRLYHLEVNASSSTVVVGTPTPSDWHRLLAGAGFSLERLRTVSPRQLPPVFADNLAAWEGDFPAEPSFPVRIEAAAFRGVPVWLNITAPWSRYSAARLGQIGPGETFLEAFWLVFHLTWLLAGFLLARHNLRRGRGDRQGAFRLAVVMFVLIFLKWLISGGGWHVFTNLHDSVSYVLAESCKAALQAWMGYLAFEPFVRRLWPERIISWNRALAGRFRDPLVGRDVLVGCLLGLATALASCVAESLQNHRLEWPRQEVLSGGLQGSFQGLIATLFDGLAMSLVFMLFLLVLRILFRRQSLAIFLQWALLTWGFAERSGPVTLLSLAWLGLAAAVPVVAWSRFGPLTGSICWVTYGLALHYPLTLDRSAWYSGISLFAVISILSLALYGFATSVAGQPWFTRSGVLDD